MPEFVEDTDRPIGTYRAKFVALDLQYPITPRATGVQEMKWRWVFQNLDPKDPDPVIDTISNPGFKPLSNNRKFLTGMLGRAPRGKTDEAPGDDPEALIGQVFDVDYGPNQGGRNTIVNVRKVTPTAPQNVTDLKTATDKAEDHKRAQEGETAIFRETEVPVTDPVTEELPF